MGQTRMVGRHTSSLRNHLLIGISILMPLLIAYWPLFTGYFLFNDDAFIWEMKGNCSTHPQFYFVISLGRVFFALLSCVEWSFVKTIHDLNICRLINVGTLAISAVIFCQWLIKNSIHRIHSILVSIAIFVLPTFQPQMASAGTFSVSIGLLASLCAGWVACRGAQEIGESWSRLFNRYTFFAALLLFFSMTNYTSLCTFYFVVIAVPLIHSSSWSGLESRKQFYLFGLFFITACIYFLFARLCYVLVPAWVDMPEEIWHRVVIVKDFRWKIPVFFKTMFIALNLWNFPPTHQVAWAVAFALLLGAAAGLVGPWRSASFFKGLFIFLLFPSAVLPHLVAESSLISYRMVGALCSLTVLSLFFSIKKMSGALSRKIGNYVTSLVFLFFALFGIQQARSNLRNFITTPLHAELVHIKNALQKNELAKIRRIHIIRPSPGNFLSAFRPFPYSISDDEFGLLTSAFPQNIPGLIRCALKESGLRTDDIEKIKISHSSSYPQGRFSNRRTIVIDMREVYNQLYSNWVSGQKLHP